MFNFFREKNLKKDRVNKNGAFTTGLMSRAGNTVKPLTKKEVINKYSSTPYLKLCIDKIANGCGQSKISLYVKAPQGSTLVNKHDIIEILRNPNPLMVQSELIGALVGSLELTGEAFIFVEKAGNKPLYLWGLTLNEVVAKPTQANNYTYTFNINGSLYTVANDDVIYLRDWDFGNLYSNGTSNAYSISDNVLTNNEITTYLQTFFNNNCEPSGIMSLDDTDEDELQAFKTEYESENLGTWNKFKTFFVNKKFNYTKLSSNLNDLGVVELQKYEQDTIRTAFSVPRELIGDNSSNRAGALVAKDLFISEVLMPKMNKILDIINVRFVEKYYGDKFYLESNIESDSQKEMTVKLMTACPSAFTLNEIRVLAGYDNLKELEGQYAEKVKKEGGVNAGYDSELTGTSDRAERTSDNSNSQ